MGIREKEEEEERKKKSEDDEENKFDTSFFPNDKKWKSKNKFSYNPKRLGVIKSTTTSLS